MSSILYDEEQYKGNGVIKLTLFAEKWNMPSGVN